MHDNSEDAWLKLLMLPKCVLLAPKRAGRHHKPVSISRLCAQWSKGEFSALWNRASFPWPPMRPTSNHKSSSVQTAVSLAREGLLSKACQTLTSSGLAPDNNTTWKSIGLKASQRNPSHFSHSTSLSCPLSSTRLQHHAWWLWKKTNPTAPPDIWPIAVGEAIRRLVGKCLCSMTKAKAHDFLAPFQLGVACQGGAEKIIHGLRSCVDKHWQEVDFAVLKIDLLNAFNRVSRQAVFNACALHIPELLPWFQWCYGQYPALWHSLGTISSEIGVQQGDPLDPLLFCLVLQHNCGGCWL